MLQQYDVIILCETWIKHNELNAVKFPGYENLHQVRNTSVQGRGHGGVSFFWKSALSVTVKKLESECDDVLWILVSHCEMLVLYGCVYNPPTGSPYCNENFLDVLHEELSTHVLAHGVSHYCIVGDLNAGTGRGPDSDPVHSGTANLEPELCAVPTRANQDQTINHRGRELLDFCKSSGLVIANGRFGDDSDIGCYTCLSKGPGGTVGASLVDYLLINEKLVKRLKSFSVLSESSSDHMPLSFMFSTPGIIAEPAGDTQKIEYTRILWPKNTDMFDQKLISEQTWSMCEDIQNLTTTDVSQAVDKLYELVWNLCDDMRPKKNETNKKRHLTTPWFDKTCHQKKQELNRKLNQFRRHRGDRLLTAYLDTKTQYNKMKREKKSEHILNLRNTLVATAQSNDASFWKLLRDAETRTNPAAAISPERWLEYFAELFSCNTDISTQTSSFGCERDPGELNTPITAQELRIALSRKKMARVVASTEYPMNCGKTLEKF